MHLTLAVGFAQVDELETFVGKKNKIWVWMAVNNRLPSILAWTLKDLSSLIHAATGATPIISCALSARASILYSEDMQDGLVVAGQLEIVNPFKKG